MSIIEMKVPTIGESINEVTLSQWLKPNGSIINIFDIVKAIDKISTFVIERLTR